jgi:hypothetical protein
MVDREGGADAVKANAGRLARGQAGQPVRNLAPSVPLKQQKPHSGATHWPGSAGSPTSQVGGMISDDCNAERDAREPSNDVLDLELRVVAEEGSEYAKTEQAREYQRSENPRASITVFSNLGFHGCLSSTYTI